MKSQARPMFHKTDDGYNVTPAGVLLLAAGAMYSDPSETTPQGRENARAVIDSILAAAFAGGFCQGDVLATLLARKQIDARTKDMAQAACDAAGNDALIRIISSMGGSDSGSAAAP